MVSAKSSSVGLLMKIEGYYKTDHFLERQWRRGIPDCILIYALKSVRITSKYAIVILSRRWLQSWKVTNQYLGACDQEIFIVIEHNRLKTAYRGQIQIGQFKSKKDTETYLIQ